MGTSSDTRTPSRPLPDTPGHGVSSARPSALGKFVRDLASRALTDQNLLRRLAEAAQEFV